MTVPPKTIALVSLLVSGALIGAMPARAEDASQLRLAQAEPPQDPPIANETPEQKAAREKWRQRRDNGQPRPDGQQGPAREGTGQPNGVPSGSATAPEQPKTAPPQPPESPKPAVTQPAPAATPPPAAATAPAAKPLPANPAPALTTAPPPAAKPIAVPAAAPAQPARPPVQPPVQAQPARPVPSAPARAAPPQPQHSGWDAVRDRINQQNNATAAAPAAPPTTPRKLEDVKNARVKTQEAGGKVVIQEPDKRVIVRQNNRVVIQSDETERLRRVAPSARVEQAAPGITRTVVDRPGNVRIVTETDQQGQLLRRYRQDAAGRETTIVDNTFRRRKSNFGRNLAIGVGIGAGVVAGAAILDSLVRVPKPRVDLPREKYIVRNEEASDDDVYEALSAPPVDRLQRRYTLNEVRATSRLRDRMRRIDLDDINFEFGSWDVDPSEYHKLEHLARAMMRMIDRDPNEVFLVEGYTDAVGSDDDNLTLSDRRAEAVATVLTEQFRVPFENLSTQGYGEQYLKINTLRPERVNRRVAVRRITPLIAGNDNAPRDYDRYEHRRDDQGYDERRYDDRDERRSRGY